MLIGGAARCPSPGSWFDRWPAYRTGVGDEAPSRASASSWAASRPTDGLVGRRTPENRHRPRGCTRARTLLSRRRTHRQPGRSSRRRGRAALLRGWPTTPRHARVCRHDGAGAAPRWSVVAFAPRRRARRHGGGEHAGPAAGCCHERHSARPQPAALLRGACAGQAGERERHRRCT